ncbi:hypothetical protein [Mycolicibacterium palauense]|uniref:hypothetical protein n=1 Tax=Mycolicibacterium palauense TaxID=2034511 RepID=UPI000BFEC073|nr:hypothetical protein [Mycolicibacterium palauense]
MKTKVRAGMFVLGLVLAVAGVAVAVAERFFEPTGAPLLSLFGSSSPALTALLVAALGLAFAIGAVENH